MVSKAFLGLTVACARCHDHKFDPITSKDYYALAGYLQSSRYQHAFIDSPDRIDAKAVTLETLRAEIRTKITSEKPSIAPYLLAARQALLNPERPLTEFAEVHQIDAPALTRWVEALKDDLARQPGHPLFAWTQLGLATADSTSEVRESLRRALLDRLRKRPSDDSSVFEDFESGTYRDWFATGQAFGAAPSHAGDLRVSAEGVVPIPAGLAHSGLVSDRLQGVLRSKTFEIKHRFIHYLASGRKGRINLVIDGFEKIRSPIYGGLVFDVNTDRPRWYAQDVSMWVGHRGYIELSDGATADYTTGHTRYVAGDGFLAVDEIRFSDHADSPVLPDRFTPYLIKTPEAASPEGLAARFEQVVARTLERWRARALEPDDQVGVSVLSWLRQRDLIPPILAPPSLLAHYREIESQIPEPSLALALADGTSEDEHVQIRGNYRTPGEIVPRRFLEVIAGHDQTPPSQGSGRLELARRVVDPANPLTARVLVNRVWLHHFGKGLVPSPDDFGHMGQPPSHPELLDWLASAFIENGWSIKQLHRMIVLSHAYQMSSRPDPEIDRLDPDNRLLHRMNVRRLEAEAIRDAMLAVSGRLDRSLFGPSVPPHLTPFMEGRGRPATSGPLDGNGRRSLYINVRRNFMTPMLLAFDFPQPATTMGRRNVSNVPAQALTLLNDPFVLEQARLWAKHVLTAPDATPESRLDAMYRAAFGRGPTDTERSEALEFLGDKGRAGDLDTWSELAHVLFNVKEFVFVN